MKNNMNFMTTINVMRETVLFMYHYIWEKENFIYGVIVFTKGESCLNLGIDFCLNDRFSCPRKEIE